MLVLKPKKGKPTRKEGKLRYLAKYLYCNVEPMASKKTWFLFLKSGFAGVGRDER